MAEQSFRDGKVCGSEMSSSQPSPRADRCLPERCPPLGVCSSWAARKAGRVPELSCQQFRWRRIGSVRLRKLYDHTVVAVRNDESLTPLWMFVTLAHHCQSQRPDI